MTTTDMRNECMGAVMMADNVDGAVCFLCDTDIHNGDKIYADLENDQSIHYSHVGERVDYGVWMGTGKISPKILKRLINLEGALIVDEGDYLGYFHPKMEKDGFGLAYPGQVHYERLCV